jgi:hypothetical protein
MIETTLSQGIKVQFLACDICGKRYISTNNNVLLVREEAHKDGWQRRDGKDVCVTCRFNVKE